MSTPFRRVASAVSRAGIAALAVGAVAAVAAVLSTPACTGRREAANTPPPPDSMPVVVLETSMGRIVMQLDRNRAPRTVDNILLHLGVNFYDGLIFHRVLRDFVVQTGMMTPDGMVRTSNAPPVAIESENGLRNVRGSVGLARGDDPNSGGVQFYFSVRDNPRLNFIARERGRWGYTVFGRVTEGMDVVDRISRVRTATVNGEEGMPLQPIVVTRAYLAVPGAPGSPVPARQ